MAGAKAASAIDTATAADAKADMDEELFRSIKNADDQDRLYEVPDASLEAALRLEQAGRITLGYSGSKCKAGVVAQKSEPIKVAPAVEKPDDLSIPEFMRRAPDDENAAAAAAGKRKLLH